MPTYDYVCRACGHELELFQSMTEAPKRKCPACGKLRLERQIGAGAGFLFKGSGFYLTDYRSDSYKKGAEAERKASDAGSKTKSDAKADGSAGKAPKTSDGSKPSERKAG